MSGQKTSEIKDKMKYVDVLTIIVDTSTKFVF